MRTDCILIPVMYLDGQMGKVSPGNLDKLLEDREAISFRRSSGWVVVGRDPVRNGGRHGWRGCERRKFLR